MSDTPMKFIKLFLGLSLFWCGNLHALALSDLRTEIRTEINDDPTDTARRAYSDAVLLRYLNEAQKEIVNFTWLCERATSYVLSPGTTYYPLPTNLIAVHQIYFYVGGVTTELEEKSQKGLYDDSPSWETQSGQPSDYWISSSSNPASQVSAPLFISYIPIPTSQSTGTVTIWFYNMPTDLSADADVPFDNRRNLYLYHMALAYHVISRIKQMQGQTEAQDYNSRYERVMGILKENLGKMPNYSPSFSIPSIKR